MLMKNTEKEINLVIITGMSGAGKTVAIQKLEDLGYFCVDNLPPILIPKFAELLNESGGKFEKVAVVTDLRGREFFDSLFEALEKIRNMNKINYQILFLDSHDSVLVQRYKETRRHHPLAPQGLPVDGIRQERQLLQELKGRADLIIDTSNLTPILLKEKISSIFSKFSKRLTINIQSFGFKYGIPIDADLVFDVRFLPNPHYIQNLRPLTGKNREVSEYVFKWDVTNEFIKKLTDLVDYTLPNYQAEGKSQLVIGIGCTGGKHRSVAIAEFLGNRYKDQYNVRLTHRDIERGKS